MSLGGEDEAEVFKADYSGIHDGLGGVFPGIYNAVAVIERKFGPFMATRRRNMSERIVARQFDIVMEALRALILAKAKPFPDDPKLRQERIARGAGDMELFGRTYFPHYIESACEDLHRYICDRYPRLIKKAVETGQGDREADAAPRGNAKSTWTTLILPICCAAYKYRLFPLIVSEPCLSRRSS